MSRIWRRRAGREGFTLLELIVVITIIGILSTFVVTRIAGSTDKARAAKIKNDLQAIYRAAQTIQAQTGYWPETIEEMVNPTDADGETVAGGLDKVPADPWGQPYEYELGDSGPVVRCLGKDGSESGEGENKDYTYPEDETGF